MQTIRTSLQCRSSSLDIRQDNLCQLEQEFNQYDRNLTTITQQNRLSILSVCIEFLTKKKLIHFLLLIK